MKQSKKQPLRYALPVGLAFALCCTHTIATADPGLTHQPSQEQLDNDLFKSIPSEGWLLKVLELKNIVKQGNLARRDMHSLIRQYKYLRTKAKGHQKMIASINQQQRFVEENEFPRLKLKLHNGRRAYIAMRDLLRSAGVTIDELERLEDMTQNKGSLLAKVTPKVITPAAANKDVDAPKINDIRFIETPQALTVTIAANEKTDYSVEQLKDSKVALNIPQAVLPPELNKHFDTSQLNSPLKSLDAYQENGKVYFVAKSNEPDTPKIYKQGNNIVWQFDKAPKQLVKTDLDRRLNMTVSSAEPRAAKAAPNEQDFSKSYGTRTTLKDTPFSKQRITLDVRDVEIQDLLRLISDEINVSIVTSPDVKGTVTLSLKSVPLDQALDIILRMNDLGMKYEGNVIWVAKSDVFREEEKRALEAAMVREKLEPLEVRLIPINYATAADLQKNVKALLSERGSMEIDSRTNTMIVKDVKANIDAIEILVNSLDTQTPQILIEARIIETQSNFTKQLGVQWGGDGILSSKTGNATGIAFPSSIGIAGGSTSEVNTGTSATPNFAVNLPASVGTGSGGALGMTFGSIGGALNINLRLSALEEKGFLKIVSAPRVMTLDNVKASIEQGTSIPISVVSAAGAQTVFFDAKLNLQVTPHATRDGNVFLKIDVQKNEPDFGNKGANGDPSIIRKEAHTQLLIPDGNTTVIGGIYTRNSSQSVSSVPFFGSIPIIGYFFRSTAEKDNRTELLIFITPRIINKRHSIAAAGPGSFVPPAKDEKKK